MENVPWHSDVKAFSEALAMKSSGEYEVACEHAHSCCVLLAKVDKFKIKGEWHTWIDYERFHELVIFTWLCHLCIPCFSQDHLYQFIVAGTRWLQESLLGQKTTWCEHQLGLCMELRKVDLIQINLDSRRRDVMVLQAYGVSWSVLSLSPIGRC